MGSESEFIEATSRKRKQQLKRLSKSLEADKQVPEAAKPIPKPRTPKRSVEDENPEKPTEEAMDVSEGASLSLPAPTRTPPRSRSALPTLEGDEEPQVDVTPTNSDSESEKADEQASTLVEQEIWDNAKSEFKTRVPKSLEECKRNSANSACPPEVDIVTGERQGESGVNLANREECGTDLPGPPGVSNPSDGELKVEESSIAREEEGWLKELTRACGVHLSPDHPCLEYIRGQGLDLGTSGDFDRFTGNPAPLGGKKWYLSVTVKGRNAEFLVDTGASHCLISKKFHSLLPVDHDNLTKRVNAWTADGSSLQTYSRTFLPISIVGKDLVLSPIIADMSDD